MTSWRIAYMKCKIQFFNQTVYIAADAVHTGKLTDHAFDFTSDDVKADLLAPSPRCSPNRFFVHERFANQEFEYGFLSQAYSSIPMDSDRRNVADAIYSDRTRTRALALEGPV